MIGRELEIEEISPEEARVELSNILPAPAMKMLLNAWCAAAGQSAFVTNTVFDLTGTRPRSFSDWVIDHVDQFRVPRDDPKRPAIIQGRASS